MHIGLNNIHGNYSMSNQQLLTTDQQWDLGVIITKDFKRQKQTEKSCKTQNGGWSSLPATSMRKQQNDSPTIQISCTATSRKCNIYCSGLRMMLLFLVAVTCLGILMETRHCCNLKCTAKSNKDDSGNPKPQHPTAQGSETRQPRSLRPKLIKVF